MAIGTLLRKARSCMVRVRRAAIVRRVTRDTTGGESRINLAFVAGSAIERRVPTRQDESRVPAVVEAVAAPAVGAGVTRLTRYGEFGCLVVRRFDGGVVPCMAGDTIRAQATIHAGCRTFVARLAIRGFVCAEKRKPVRVVLPGGQRNTPSANRVTLLAGTPHLPAVEIGVAIGTLLPDTGKNRFGVALPTFHACMHPAEREKSLGMFEIGEGAHRPITGRSVAVAAGNFQRSVRAGHSSLFGFRARRCRPARLVQRVAPGACLVRCPVPQGWVAAAFLILCKAAVTIETLEPGFPCSKVVAINTMPGTAQHSVFF